MPSEKIYERGADWADKQRNIVRKTRFEALRRERELKDAMELERKRKDRECSIANGSVTAPRYNNLGSNGSVVGGENV